MTRTLTVLAHGDSDGVASAALVVAALGRRYSTVNVRFTHPVGLLSDFREFARGDIVVVDVALSETHAAAIAREFSRYPFHITYIDHHPPPVGLSLEELSAELVRPKGDEDVSSSELTYRKYGELLHPDYDRVALYGAIGDYADQSPWVKEALERWDKRQVYFEAGILVQGLEGSRGMHDFKRHIVEHLSKNRRPSQLSELLVRALIQAVNNEELHAWVEKNVKVVGRVAYVINPPGSISVAATYAKGVTRLPVGIAVEERGGTYVMSLRANPKEINLDRVLREVTPYLGGSGGGHPSAAGARVPKHQFVKLIQVLNERLGWVNGDD